MTRRNLIKNSILISAGFLGLNNKLLSNIFSDNNLSIFERIINKSEKFGWQKLSINELIINISKEFIGTHYVGGTLDGNEIEKCVINFQGLDCVTFFENSLVMARIIKKRKLTFNDLIDELTFTRYRNGELGDYSSRLHYTSDWIFDNIKKNVVIDKTELIGGEEFHPNVFFMSKNPDKYNQLKNKPYLVKKIKSIEDNINTKFLYYIPTNQISEQEKLIESGDILALATNIPGLDYSHTGLAYRDENDNLRFFHASSVKKEVLIDINLSEYMNKKKKDIGITVLKPIEPRV